MVRTEREKARERKKYDDTQLRPYTDDEIDAIEAQYDTERARGAEPRWCEDVEEGDEVGPMVKGPLTVTDMVCWHAGMGMGLYGVKPLRLAHQNRKRIPRFFHRDEHNVPDVMQRVHWDPEFARRSGNPTTFDYGRMRETWLIHLCTDWMGDDAWLWKLECEFRKFNYVGDTQWLRGRVVRKYLADGDRPAVDLELTAENQRGEVTTPGTATILLPSREHGAVRLPDPPGGARDLAGRARRDLGRVRAAMTDFAGTGTDGLVVALDDAACCTSPSTDPTSATRISDSMMRGLDRSGERRRHRRARARDPARRRAASTSAAAPTSWRATRTAEPATARGQHPAAAARPGAPARPAARDACRRRSCARCAAGPRASASSSRSPPTSRSRPPTRRSGSRSPSAGSRPTAARRGCCRAASARSAPASCCCSAGSSPGPKPPRGARSTARCPRPSSTTRSPTLVGALAHGPTVALGLSKWLLHQGAALSLEQHLANEAFALELSSRTEDFREGLAAFPERRPPEFDGR